MYWKGLQDPMKNILQFLTLGLFMATLSSCVDAGGYVSTRPGYAHPRPHYNSGNYNHGYDNNRSYGHNRPTYYPSRSSGVNARVAPVNVNSGLRLF